MARRRRERRRLGVAPAAAENAPLDGAIREVSSGTWRSRQAPSGPSRKGRVWGAALATTVVLAAALVGVAISREQVQAPDSRGGGEAISAAASADTVELVEDNEQTPSPVRFTLTVVEPSYEVQPGDTLEAIARRFGTTVEALQSINNLSDRNTLRVGQKLVIP